MNQIFSFSRWWMLITRHWGENRKRYLLSMLAIAGLMAAWEGLLIAMDKFGPVNLFMQYQIYYCGLYFVGCLYASTLFSELGHKAQAIGYLSVPASHLEKLFCAILFGVVLFFIAYTLIYYIVDIPLVGLANRVIEKEHQVWPVTLQPVAHTEVFNAFGVNAWAPIGDRKFHILMVSYFSIQSSFLLGSVYFSRFSFIKTIVSVLFLFAIYTIFMTKGVEENIPEGWHSVSFFQWRNFENKSVQPQLIKLPFWVEHLLILLMQFSAPFVCWCIAYLRLKEKEE